LQAGRKLTGPGEGRVREVGGGRKKMEETDPAVPELLPKIWEETTAGDPMSWLRWTCKSTRTLAKELTRLGHPVTWVTVARCLDQMEYSLQANRKTKEGPPHAHGDAQFRYLHGQVKAVLRGGDPVIAVDAKKKELVGPFKNAGRTGRPKGSRRKSPPRTSRAWRRGRRFPMGFTTPHRTGLSSMWESLLRRRSLGWKAFGNGGNWTGVKPIRPRGAY